jgi:hypothetical protein
MSTPPDGDLTPDDHLTPKEAGDLLAPLIIAREPIRQPNRVLLLIIAAALAFTGIAGLRIAGHVSDNAAEVARARDAIFVSCQLLDDAIAQSGGGDPRKDNREPPPQQRLNELYVTGPIHRGLTASERAEERSLIAEIKKNGGQGVRRLDCTQISLHPEDILNRLDRMPGQQPDPGP